MSPGYWSYTASILKLKSCLNVNSLKFYNTTGELESAGKMNTANTSEQSFSALPVRSVGKYIEKHFMLDSYLRPLYKVAIKSLDSSRLKNVDAYNFTKLY